jgi:ketosteroid isomerase-like protein
MHKSTSSRIAVACIALTALSAQGQSGSTSSDEAKIKESRRLQTLALAKNDLDTVVKYWDPAITIRRALGQPVDGAQAARKLLEPSVVSQFEIGRS